MALEDATRVCLQGSIFHLSEEQNFMPPNKLEQEALRKVADGENQLIFGLSLNTPEQLHSVVALMKDLGAVARILPQNDMVNEKEKKL